eukprot:1157835-Pelagomonas_calceolata.AAC.3
MDGFHAEKKYIFATATNSDLLAQDWTPARDCLPTKLEKRGYWGYWGLRLPGVGQQIKKPGPVAASPVAAVL